MLIGRLAVLVLASLTSSCFDLGFERGMSLMESGLRDASTFSAWPCPDVDGDGVDDVLLNAQDPPTSASPSAPAAWVLSGSNLSPIYSISAEGSGERCIVAVNPASVLVDDSASIDHHHLRPGDVDVLTCDLANHQLLADIGWFVIDRGLVVHAMAERSESDATESRADSTEKPDAGPPPSTMDKNRAWSRTWLIDPEKSGWGADVNNATDAEARASFDLPSMPVGREHPELEHVQVCGDIDGDGQLDWFGLTEQPRSVVQISGADMHVLRTIPMESRPFATVAGGAFGIGDIDGDGASDWLLGTHVSQSDDRLTPRTCSMGVISLVSGADFHVIQSLERASFLSGAGRKCPVVTVPPPVQP